jgi:hypothetical protein
MIFSVTSQLNFVIHTKLSNFIDFFKDIVAVIPPRCLRSERIICDTLKLVICKIQSKKFYFHLFISQYVSML